MKKLKDKKMQNNFNNKKVVGVILAYKHAGFLRDLYEKIPFGVVDSVFITNDDSGDGIEEIARELQIPCFSHARLGYGGNMKYGMQKALEMGADYVVEIHGDGQYDLAFVELAIKKMEEERLDLVLGSRFLDSKQALRDEMPIEKYIANVGLSLIERLVLGVGITEFHTGARVYSRKAIESVDLSGTSNNFLFGFEIIAQIIYHNLKIGEVPVRCYYAKEHTTIGFKDSAIYAFLNIKVLSLYIGAKLGFKTRLFHK